MHFNWGNTWKCQHGFFYDVDHFHSSFILNSFFKLGVLFKELSNNIGFSFSDQFIKNLQSSLVDTDSVLKRQEKSLAASEKKYSSRVGAALKKSKSAPITQDVIQNIFFLKILNFYDRKKGSSMKPRIC